MAETRLDRVGCSPLERPHGCGGVRQARSDAEALNATVRLSYAVLAG